MNDYFYLPASFDPLSSDVFTIMGKKRTYIIDCGSSETARDYINGIEGEKILIITHFHQDHTANVHNLEEIQTVYAGKKTCSYIKTGTPVTETLEITDGIHLDIFPLRNCHAKDSLAVNLNSKYLFTGDALCSCETPLGQGYNAGMLLETIRAIESVDTQFIVPSHIGRTFTKEKVVSQLKNIYSMRDGNNPYIINCSFELFK